MNSGIYYFCSGFTDEGFYHNLEIQLKKDLKKMENILFIPGGVSEEKINKTKVINIPRFIEYFSKINIKFKNCTLIVPNIKNANKLIKDADIIIMLGGNPFEVNNLINELNIANDIKDFNGIIMGVSAGAMNMSKYIITTPSSEEFNEFKIIPALNLCNISMFPHCNFEGTEFPAQYEMDGRVTKTVDLIEVSKKYGDYYCTQNYKDNISVIRVENNNIEFYCENNGHVWLIKENEIRCLI